MAASYERSLPGVFSAAKCFLFLCVECSPAVLITMYYVYCTKASVVTPSVSRSRLASSNSLSLKCLLLLAFCWWRFIRKLTYSEKWMNSENFHHSNATPVIIVFLLHLVLPYFKTLKSTAVFKFFNWMIILISPNPQWYVKENIYEQSSKRNKQFYFSSDHRLC